MTRFTQKELSLDPSQGLQGAYVITPDTKPSGIAIDGNISATFDFSSLYPTIKLLFNLSYGAIKYRFFDIGSIDQLMNTFERYAKSKQTEREYIIQNLTKILANSTKQFLEKTRDNEKKSAIKKQARIDHINKMYPLRLRRIFRIIETYGIKDLYQPSNDMSYTVFINDLMPLLELVHMFKINGEHDTALNLMTRTSKFITEDYKPNDTVFIIEDVHSRKRKLKKITARELLKLTEYYIPNAYGVMSVPHADYLSPDIKKVMYGLKNRGHIKNQGLIKNAIAQTMKTLNLERFKTKEELLNFKTHLDEFISNLMDTLSEVETIGLIGMSQEEIYMSGNDNIALSDVLKVYNNSDYGISAVKTNPISSIYISNSTTMNAKMIGLRMAMYIVDKEFSNLLDSDVYK